MATSPLARGRSPEQAWRVLAFLVGHWTFRGYGTWMVEEKETGAFTGITGFSNPAGWPGFELSWQFLPRFWGRGYATESARAALDHAFTVLRQDRVISLIQPVNRASIRVAERLGQSLQGRTEMVGKELLIYGIDRETYFARGHLLGAATCEEPKRPCGCARN